mmetsp:Transcript_76425/g.135421  ORF Transcript_76425/g.135421 Transcript_76425/m.135421 type:complete len:358 (-) Transcript_76425:195-1268(-)
MIPTRSKMLVLLITLPAANSSVPRRMRMPDAGYSEQVALCCLGVCLPDKEFCDCIGVDLVDCTGRGPLSGLDVDTADTLGLSSSLAVGASSRKCSTLIQPLPRAQDTLAQVLCLPASATSLRTCTTTCSRASAFTLSSGLAVFVGRSRNAVGSNGLSPRSCIIREFSDSLKCICFSHPSPVSQATLTHMTGTPSDTSAWVCRTRTISPGSARTSCRGGAPLCGRARRAVGIAALSQRWWHTLWPSTSCRWSPGSFACAPCLVARGDCSQPGPCIMLLPLVRGSVQDASMLAPRSFSCIDLPCFVTFSAGAPSLHVEFWRSVWFVPLPCRRASASLSCSRKRWTSVSASAGCGCCCRC